MSIAGLWWDAKRHWTACELASKIKVAGLPDMGNLDAGTAPVQKAGNSRHGTRLHNILRPL